MLELRFPLPEDVRHGFLDAQQQPRSHIIRSLGTRDPKMANAKADLLRSEIRQEISKLRAEKTVAGTGKHLAWLYEAELSSFREALAATARQRQLARVSPGGSHALGIALNSSARAEYGEALLSSDPEEVAATAGWAADEFFAQRGEVIDRSSKRYRAVLDDCAGALADAVIAKADLEADRPITPPRTPNLVSAINPGAGIENARHVNGTLPITEYFESVYVSVADAIHAPSTGERNITGKRHSVALFAALVGDLPIASISKDKQYDFLDQLRHYPDSRRISGELKKLPAKVIVQRMISGDLTLPRINPKTSNKHLANISTIVAFAERRRHTHKADAKGVREEHIDTEDAGRPFTTAELNRIFSLPLFTGCAGDEVERGVFKSGDVLIRDDRFWIPLVLLFTGGRSAEVVGLEVDDVVLDHDTPHFLVVPNSTRPTLKNRFSRRMVPIHSRLIDLGFHDHVRKMAEEGHKRVFPMAEQPDYRGSSTGRRQRSLSAALIMRQFNRTHLEHANASDNGGSTKCFRNTFEQEASSKIPHDEVRQRLTGRKVVSSARIYTDNIPFDPEQRAAQLVRLKTDIELVTYPHVKLDHLMSTP